MSDSVSAAAWEQAASRAGGHVGSPRRGVTRARLLQAAGVVFAEMGAEAATVEEITERAGFTRGAFYSNFKSKEELFLELALQLSEKKLAAIDARLEELKRGGLADFRADEIAQALLEALVDDRVGVLLMSEVRTTAMRIPEIGAAYLAWTERMLAAVTAIIDEVLREAGLRGRLPASEIARHLIMTWEATSSQATIERLSPEALRDTVMQRVSAIAQVLVDEHRLERS